MAAMVHVAAAIIDETEAGHPPVFSPAKLAGERIRMVRLQ